MTAAAFRFSAEARADLTRLLRDHAPATTIGALEHAVDRYRRAERQSRDGDAQDAAERAWLAELQRRLSAVSAHVETFERIADRYTLIDSDHLHRAGRAELLQVLARYGAAAREDAQTRASKPGRRPVPRLVLSVALMKALRAADVPLSKGRAGLVHSIFAIVYDELRLSAKGDVFAAVQQGVTVVTKGARLRLRKKQVL